MLNFPRDLYAEWYIGGEWHSIAADIRQTAPVLLNHGTKDAAPAVSPCRATFTLDDGPEGGNGDYNPQNPLGRWHGQLGRNTRLRMGYNVGADSFDRTVAVGWGAGPLGTWTSYNGDASVVATGARHSVPLAVAYRFNYLTDVVGSNVDLRVDVQPGVVDVQGGPIEPANLVLRGLNSTQYYALRVSISAAEVITVAIYTQNSPLSSVATVPLSYTGQKLRVRFQSDQNTFRGKVWSAASSEPLNWHIEYSHGAVWSGGWVGIRSGVGPGNTNAKPVTFDYTDFRVRLPRFAGEVAKLVPRSEVDHSNPRTEVEAAGIMRRMQQGKRTLATPFERYLTRTPPFTVAGYWPLDADKDSSAIGVSPLSHVDAAEFARASAATGSVKWGESTRRLSVDRAVTLANGGILSTPVDPTTFGTSFAATWTQQLGADARAAAYLFMDDGGFLQVDLLQSGRVDVYHYAPGAGVGTLVFGLTPTTYTGDDNQWQNVGLSVERAGPTNTIFMLSFEGTSGVVYTSNRGFLVNGRPTKLVFIAGDTSPTYAITLAHVGIYPHALFDGSPVLVSLVQRALNGYPGEEAGTRFTRLMTEEAIPYALVGYPTVSQRMGGQGRLTLLQHAKECADADVGALYEPTGSVGLALRTTRSFVAQEVALWLDYGAGQVAAPFAQTTDDQGVVNDVTAKRPNAGEYRYEQTWGSLNVQDPGANDQAAGRYDDTVTVNTETDGDLVSAAAWRVHMGTIDEPRVPTLTVNLAARDVVDAGLTQAVLDVGIGDLIVVTNATDAGLYEDLRLIVRGWSERLDNHRQHVITFNTTPASVYDAAHLDDATARLATGFSVLTDNESATDTTVRVSSVGALWSTTAAPFDIMVRGERMTVTNVTGTASPQTFTVARSVNGVTKNQLSNAPVQLASPRYVVP